jgi:putative N6-adenine-specific DNA methylase
MSRAAHSLFAVCAPGLEPVAASELQALGIEGRAEAGGIAFKGADAVLFRASLGLRTATRLLLRLGEFRARSFADLERHAGSLPWRRVLGPGARVRLRVSCGLSRLYHEGAVAERLLAAIGNAAAATPAPATPRRDEEAGDDAQLFVVRILRDVCTVSADASGAPLYMRGYRQALARAPLRETLAAALLIAARWPGDVPLLDPLCGSGTIAIEGALMARGIPPALANPGHLPRRFRFMDWPGFAAAEFAAAVERAIAAIRPHAGAPILASDRNAGAIRAATANAERAGVRGDIEFTVRALADLCVPGPRGWLVTNAPYGVRAGDDASNRELAREFGRHVGSTLAGWTVAALTADNAMRGALGPGAVERIATRNGGIPVRLRVREPVPETPSGPGP